MKQVKLNKMKKLIILLTTLSLLSCTKPKPIENYKGAIVYSKTIYVSLDRDYDAFYYTIKVGKDDSARFEEVRTMKFDFNKYDIGDTIR